MHGRLKTITALILSAVITLLPATGAFAATEKDVAQALIENTYTYEVSGIVNDPGDTIEFPEKLDLRDRGVITPVKLQNPFGACWGFSAIAAAESSILSASGQTYEETGLDLSEHQLAYFTRVPLRDGSSQDGEGSYLIGDTDPLNTGGWFFTATSVFSSGIGVVPEGIVPYRGKEGIIDYQLGMLISYSARDDWSVDEDYRFLQYYQLQESNILPEPAVKKWNEDQTEYEYLAYNENATNAIKNELMEGRAVSIAFSADQYMPGVKSNKPKYLSDNWCHYTWDNGSPNHAVTIVGWDDTVPASDFLPDHQPEGDGAWIVKNSWGAETSTFPNWMIWGLKNEEGKSTGYFYLSYYDHSITCPETFDFSKGDKNNAYMIDQYDYMPGDMVPNAILDENKLRTANVFEAEYDEYVKEISVETAQQYTDVSYEVYLLRDGFTDPTDGEKVSEGTEHYVYSGYHKIPLSEPVEVPGGGKYAIVVTETVDTGDAFGLLYCLASDRAKNEEGAKEYNSKVPKDEREMIYSRAVVNKGESYLYTDITGTWLDWSDIVDELHKDEDQRLYDYDNFPIKGYANFKDPALAEEFSGKNMGCCYPEPVNGQEWYQQKAYEQLLFMILGVFTGIIVLIICIFIGLGHLAKKNRWKKRELKLIFVGDENAEALSKAVEALSRKGNRNVYTVIRPVDDRMPIPENDDYVIMKDGIFRENGMISEIPAAAEQEDLAKEIWGVINKDAFGKASWKNYRKFRKQYRYVERLIRR